MCGSFCELRDEFVARAGCGSQEMALNACEASARSCGDALALVCDMELSDYRACGVAYCRATPADAFCQEACMADPAFCP